jgi:hypothetical protein
LGALWAWLALVATVDARADWTISPRGSVALTENGVTGILEFSGVTYVGPTASGLHRFAAIQDSGNQIVFFDIGASANGTINAATAVHARSLAPAADYEGIAFTGSERNSVFVSEEGTPGVHEHSLSTGARLQSAPLPAVYHNDRANKSLESLTRSLDGRALWTGNEEALTPDGPPSSATGGTFVRLQKFTELEAALVAGPQFAYAVDPIHTTINPNRSGLVDLVMLPDDGLLALERSAAAALPAFRNRVYQIGVSGATDTSAGEFADGLADKTFTPVVKTLRWSGQVGGAQGTNMEGLALGPALESGNWLLVGVVDDGGSGATTIASFELAITGTAAAGDFNRDGVVDRADYVLWKNTYGSNVLLAADGNGNQVVDAADYTIWRNHLPATGGSGAQLDKNSARVPEPGTAWQAFMANVVLYGYARHRPASSRPRQR